MGRKTFFRTPHCCTGKHVKKDPQQGMKTYKRKTIILVVYKLYFKNNVFIFCFHSFNPTMEGMRRRKKKKIRKNGQSDSCVIKTENI